VTCFLWGYVKDRVFVPQLPRDRADLKARIIAAVKNIDAPLLMRVWQEIVINICNQREHYEMPCIIHQIYHYIHLEFL
jgi:hypothetical protein